MWVYVAFGEHARTGGEQQRVLAPTDFSWELYAFLQEFDSRWGITIGGWSTCPKTIYIYIYVYNIQ